MTVTSEAGEVAARRLHYGQFYGLLPVDSNAPIAVVSGNCQAESLRIMLDGPDLHTVRIPAVFELVEADLPHLARLLARARYFISQPVRDDYHDLPLGTAQLASLLPPGAQVVRMPVVRFAGLYPFHALVRPPFDLSLVPPVVEYHDLRTVMEAVRLRAGGEAGFSGRPGLSGPAGRPALDARQVRAVAAESTAELRKRESHHDTVVVSDLFETPDFTQMRTINHPGNPLWTEVGARVRARLGLAPHVVDPGRPLLNAVHAPREARVIEAFGLDAEPRSHWIIDGREIAEEEVERAHLDWYARHPAVLDAAIARHRGTLETLGLLAPGGSS